MADPVRTRGLALWSSDRLGPARPAEAGLIEVLVKTPAVGPAAVVVTVVQLLLPPLMLDPRDMAVILTMLTELTWGVGITVLMGLLVMSNVGGDRKVRAPVAEGLGRIWA